MFRDRIEKTRSFFVISLDGQDFGLYYYKREDSQLEEDFFVRTQQELLPLEVKSNRNTSKSLSTLIKGEKYSDILHGIKLSAGNIGFSNGIYTFPYFCAFLLKRCLKSWDQAQRRYMEKNKRSGRAC